MRFAGVGSSVRGAYNQLGQKNRKYVYWFMSLSLIITIILASVSIDQRPGQVGYDIGYLLLAVGTGVLVIWVLRLIKKGQWKPHYPLYIASVLVTLLIIATISITSAIGKKHNVGYTIGYIVLAICAIVLVLVRPMKLKQVSKFDLFIIMGFTIIGTLAGISLEIGERKEPGYDIGHVIVAICGILLVLYQGLLKAPEYNIYEVALAPLTRRFYG
jgi:hypothetical protein